MLTWAFKTPVLAAAALTTGAVWPEVAANAGAASTETASRAAEMVFNMAVSSFNGDRESDGRMTGLGDLGCDIRRRR